MAGSVVRAARQPTAEESLAASVQKLTRKSGKRLRGTRRGDVSPKLRRPGVATILLLIGPGVPEPDGIVCSLYWAQRAREAMFDGVAKPCTTFAAVWRSLYFSRIYPPRDEGRRPAMRVCEICGRDCPASAIESDVCVDCHENRNARDDDMPASSVEGAVVRLIQFARTFEEFLVLEYEKEDALRKAESDAQLRKELRRYQKGTWKPEPWRSRRRTPNIRGT